MTNPADDITPASPETPVASTAPAAPPRRRWLPIAIGAGAGIVVLGLGIGGFAIADALDEDGDDDRVPASVESPAGQDEDSDRDDQDAEDAAADDASRTADPITDDERESATEAAIDAAGGGEVTDVDRSDDPGEAWEVEVLLENGDEMDVRLADDFSVISTDLDPRS